MLMSVWAPDREQHEHGVWSVGSLVWSGVSPCESSGGTDDAFSWMSLTFDVGRSEPGWVMLLARISALNAGAVW